MDGKMQVLTKEGGEVVPNLYCIGDANGKLMLAHAASAHGVRYATSCFQNEARCARPFSYIGKYGLFLAWCVQVLFVYFVCTCAVCLPAHGNRYATSCI